MEKITFKLLHFIFRCVTLLFVLTDQNVQIVNFGVRNREQRSKSTDFRSGDKIVYTIRLQSDDDGSGGEACQCRQRYDLYFFKNKEELFDDIFLRF